MATIAVNPAVIVENVSKVYRTYAKPWDRIAERLGSSPRHRAHQALRDVSFELPVGEALGIVGENGAGKSTLLKILAGITTPTHGRVRVKGTIAAILELGSGFHPEFTGRQNIALTAAMLGLGKADVERVTPTIIAFSELDSFIDEPVKHYSTGMAMRLAFSIAVQVEPDVLIVDEALSVGDGYFQKKCMDRLRRYLADGGTLLFCSHAMYYVSAFCRRAIWLRRGEVAGMGPTDEVVPAYEAFLERKRVPAPRVANGGNPEAEAEQDLPAAARITSVVVQGQQPGDSPIAIESGVRLRIEIGWRSQTSDTVVHLAVGINRASDGIEVCAFGSHEQRQAPNFTGIEGRAVLDIPAMGLVKGAFDLYVFLLDEAGLHIYDRRIFPESLAIRKGSYSFGLVTMAHAWHRLGPNDEPTRSEDATTA